MLLAVTLVHTHEHLRPILRFCSTCACHDLQHGGHSVLLVGKHVLHLEVLDFTHGVCVGGIHLLIGNQFFLVIIERELQFLGSGAYALVAFYPAAQAFNLAHLSLGSLGVFPEPRGLGVQFFFLELDTFLVDGEIRLEFVSALLYVFELFDCYHVC